MSEREALKLALRLARAVEGRTAPRPPVGAVLVRDGEVIGRGATAPPFGPHAEAEALAEAGPRARGATLYVTLEPCCISGHTPPCTEALIAAGIRRAVVAARDPNPQVYGHGLARLRQAGIEIELLSEEAEAREARSLLRPFATFITQGRPYVTAKWAMTLDGKIASHTGDACWISGARARQWTHDLRDRVDAIMIGAGTARRDNPQLTVRLAAGSSQQERRPRLRPPLRVVLTTRGDLVPELRLLSTPPAAATLVFTGEVTPPEQLSRLARPGVTVLTLPMDGTGRLDLRAALRRLARENVMHVLLEGGATLLGSAFDAGLIDHVVAIVAPRLIGGARAPTPLGGRGLAAMARACTLANCRHELLDEDLLIEGEPLYAVADPAVSGDRQAGAGEII
jgi:diaminohydroxyphosphoribosylaminopyrimidine deaminase/5-amino-6-(5-phosphoribosylamino)uracil reductase